MTIGVVKTQGTELFLLDNFTVPATPVALKFSCPTGITGLGGAADPIEDTCLDNQGDKTFQRGLGNPGQVTVPFNLTPRDVSHQILFQRQAAGTVLSWIACLSESATDPTVAPPGAAGVLVAPTTRTSFKFEGYIADVNIDVATNEIVRGTMSIQRSGVVTPTWFTPT